MRFLVLGSGAREHALCWKLLQEAEVIAAPGNPGIAEICPCFPVDLKQHSSVLDICKNEKVDCVVVGPEDPLIAGIADDLRVAGIAVYGPNSDLAELEGSKKFAKEWMIRTRVPTARSQTHTELDEAIEYANSRLTEVGGVAIKASGAALGKGVILCRTADEAESAIHRCIVAKEFGSAGETILIEDLLLGYEFSLLTMVSGQNFHSLPVAQDYKRAFDSDQGPNTGGMGTYSPVPSVTPELIKKAEAKIVATLLQGFHEASLEYRGTLFSGIMVFDGEPFCLEYNVRFGDPETQTVLSRLGKGFAEAIFAVANGNPIPQIEVKNNACATVVLASKGYPGDYEKGHPIHVGTMPSEVQVFHAGTAIKDGKHVNSGGRVLSVTATAASIREARKLAYEAIEQIDAPNLFYRRDIALDV